MTQKRIGQGHDLHRLEAGGPLRLCGIDVDAPFEAVGHSDADVGIHALVDALLGAAQLGDIGRTFPDTDPAHADANSADLLWEVHNRVRSLGWRIENVDLTIHLERPRLAPYASQFAARLGGITNVTPYRFNIKAKTAEGLGPVGDSAAVAADCVVLLTKMGR
ncbi:MAG: 2-C-methyl-D-erythritol 2,4-cyclodiphosphate synthase [Chloroflexi bacterium]|nr:2-C-methyl-D-erythritol 2,4-cyclodiphosphate synthase [Chloroflexota bacterium]